MAEPWAWYNENDPHAAQWLRNLIAMGEIAPGEVDERSILDVTPDDLRNFTQCHFFAGIGIWSYALRLAGWPDDRPVWTGSCPCQPFSAAGKGDGFADERHLWPAWHWLIGECRPPRIYGEQVADRGGLAWLDLVLADLEGTGYAAGALDLCSAGVGAPHKRQRLHLMADAESQRLLGRPDDGDSGGREHALGQRRSVGLLVNSERPRLEGHRRNVFGGAGTVDLLDDGGRPGPANGLWRDADWLFCTDGKWRSARPGTQPLVDGSAFKLGSGGAYENKSRAKMLKGAGNAINAELAAWFIRATM